MASQADPASYCEQLWLSGEDKGAHLLWMDEAISPGVECTNLPSHPKAGLAVDLQAGSGAGGSGRQGQEGFDSQFPRRWRDGDGKQRGSSWMFFPDESVGGGGEGGNSSTARPKPRRLGDLTGEWTSSGSDRCELPIVHGVLWGAGVV